ERARSAPCVCTASSRDSTHSGVSSGSVSGTWFSSFLDDSATRTHLPSVGSSFTMSLQAVALPLESTHGRTWCRATCPRTGGDAVALLPSDGCSVTLLCLTLRRPGTVSGAPADHERRHNVERPAQETGLAPRRRPFFQLEDTLAQKC